MQEHIPVIDELSLHSQFGENEIPRVLTELKNIILQGMQHGFTHSQKVLISSDFLEKEIAPGVVLSQWLFSKVEKDPNRDLKSYFIQILGSRAYINDLKTFEDSEYYSGDNRSIGMGYAHIHNQPCFSFPEKEEMSQTFDIRSLQQNLLQKDGSFHAKEIHVGIILKTDGFHDLRTALVNDLCEADNISGKEILNLAWFCFPNLDFSDEAVSDLQNVSPAFPAKKVMVHHLECIDMSVYDFAHKAANGTDSFLEILISKCGTQHASDENDDTKNDHRKAQDHCFYFPSLGEKRYCFLHTKYTDFRRIYFEHDVSLHKAHIGRLNIHLLV